MGSAWSSAFVQAAQDGDLHQVRALWSAREIDNIDVRAERGRTALLVAVHCGHAAVVKWLLEQGASTAIVTPQGYSALQLAVARHHPDVVSILLDHGAPINAYHGVALTFAVGMQDVAMVALLLERGASPELREPRSFAPLQLAAREGALEVVEWLLVYGANASVKDADGTGHTPMLLASYEGHTAIVKRLLDHDLALSLDISRDGNTPLLRACYGGHLPVVETIIDALGRDHRVLETPNHFGQTPLMIAALSDFDHIVRYLVDLNVALEAKDMHGFTALMFAANEGHSAVLNRLVLAGAQVTAVDRSGHSALELAARRGHLAIVDILLEHDVVVDRVGIYSITALMSAAGCGHVAIVRSLLHHGASVHSRTHRGWTPVLFAAENGHVDVVRVLLEHGASLEAPSDDHWTPLMVAVENGHASLCAFLLDRGVTCSVCKLDGQTALHYAVVKGFPAIVELLLEYGAAVDTVDHSGQTPSASAAVEGHFDILEMLARAGAQPLDETTYQHPTWPLHAVRELYNPCKSTLQETKLMWFVDPSQISAVEPTPRLSTPITQASIGTWSGTRVLVLKLKLEICEYAFETETDIRRFFQREVSRWFPLRHPHVARLFGACHRGTELFLVAEHPAHGTLRSYLATNPSETWTKLYEIALGVQYLHERGIVHGNLVGEHLLIGDNHKAKLAGFGLMHSEFVIDAVDRDARSNQSSVHDHPYVWDAWEVVRGCTKTTESDIYSLGMCILEAVSGDVPYAAEIAAKLDLKKLIGWGVLPERPRAMSDRAWTLVTQMTCYEYVDRLKIADVVRELAALARDDANDPNKPMRSVGSLAVSPIPMGLDSPVEVEHVEELLAILWSLVGADDGSTGRTTPQQQVLHRLLAITSSVDAEDEQLPVTVLPQLADIITRFTNDLQARTGTSSAASFAVDRQHESRIFSLHNDIDRVLEQLHPAQPAPIDPTHAWRDNWHAHRREQLQAFGDSFPRIQDHDVETSTCLLFELTRHRDAYTSIAPLEIQAACERLRSKPGVRVPDWFIPYYEVAFDESRSFSSGSFGSVHHGEWMGSRAVIKKVFSADQETNHSDSEFTKEVELWSQLYHPHVLQLFGACHVGQKFLVSEFASHGQLDKYLDRRGGRRRRDVWRLLHEAALGLQYLHSRGIVHCDLKCNNILVGGDGKAKLSDYGLSHTNEPRDQLDATTDVTTVTSPPSRVGAPRWKAPEVLKGAAPTFESDIYGFAMCIVEAVTGEYPWGSRDPDELVHDHVRRGGALFTKPRIFSDAQWDLVVRASHFEPHERMPLEDIIARLKVFADASEQEEPDVDEEKMDSADKSVSELEGLAFSTLAVPTALDHRFTGLLASEPNIKPDRASYCESW